MALVHGHASIVHVRKRPPLPIPMSCEDDRSTRAKTPSSLPGSQELLPMFGLNSENLNSQLFICGDASLLVVPQSQMFGCGSVSPQQETDNLSCPSELSEITLDSDVTPADLPADWQPSGKNLLRDSALAKLQPLELKLDVNAAPEEMCRNSMGRRSKQTPSSKIDLG
jgi:hypothetical protein